VPGAAGTRDQIPRAPRPRPARPRISAVAAADSAFHVARCAPRHPGPARQRAVDLRARIQSGVGRLDRTGRRVPGAIAGSPGSFVTGPVLPLPADLYGRRRTDRTLRVLDAVVNARLNWTALTNRRDLTPRVDDRRIPVVVTGRRVEAADEDVVSLRLSAPDRRDLPRS